MTVRERGRPVGAAALSTGADVVGVSCVVSHGQDPDATWAAVVHAATQLFPGRLLVGYESGEDLDAARRAGFTPTGPVRIWHRP
ncbi:hypothetical protein GB931_11390 [Modestobacter sp. I12A-02628]|nr:hypothetical protein [Goekera deserti]